MRKLLTTAALLTLSAPIALADDAAKTPAETMDKPAAEMKVDADAKSDAAKPANETTAEKQAVEKTASDTAYYVQTEKTDFLASSLIGARIYATTTAVDDTKPVEKVTAEWKDIGEINNIVLGRDGEVKAVVLGVGGFLGIGEKDVAVKMSELRFVKKAGADASDYFIVVKSDKASLENAPPYERKSS